MRHRFFSSLAGFLSVCAIFIFTPDSRQAADRPASTPTGADRAWDGVLEASRLPDVPQEWQENRPSQEEWAQFRKRHGEMAGEAADKARRFYTAFPEHPKAAEARAKEYEMVETAALLGDSNRLRQLLELERAKVSDPSLTPDERFDLRVRLIHLAAMRKESDGIPGFAQEIERGVRALQKDFPDRPEVYQMLLELASNAEAPKARALAQELLDGGAPMEIKESAGALLRKTDLAGRPLPLKFTAIDGRVIDLASMKGKVVLVDFWATWCAPCIAELPELKKLHQELHPKGLEVVGISFDRDLERLKRFVAEEQMPWPQFFDAEGEYGQQFGITTIPTMILIDREGNVRDLNARVGLERKARALLNEK